MVPIDPVVELLPICSLYLGLPGILPDARLVNLGSGSLEEDAGILGLVPAAQTFDHVQNLATLDSIVDQNSNILSTLDPVVDPVVDQNSKKNSSLGTDDYEVLKPLDLDKPFNFTFPGYIDLNSFDPLLEAQVEIFSLSGRITFFLWIVLNLLV